jgi:hypothetical protein
MVVVIWVELVATEKAPDKGGGVIVTVYMTSFPPFELHSIVTVEFPIPSIELL